MQRNEHVLDRLCVSTRPLKRAQYEAFAFDIVPEGVRVTNHSHADPREHTYLVSVRDGVPTACTCPADATSDAACKHRLAVAIRRPVLDAAGTRVAADGGVDAVATEQDGGATADEDGGDDDGDPDCDCDGLADDFPCFNCFLHGRRSLPEP